MMRIVLSVIAGFLSWALAWFGGEKLLSALMPERFGAHQRAFEAAVIDGGAFTANTTHLLLHIVLGALASVLAGFVAALIARNNTRAPMALGVLLLAFGVLKAVASWPLVPIWYHVTFTALLIPMALLGGKLRTTA